MHWLLLFLFLTTVAEEHRDVDVQFQQPGDGNATQNATAPDGTQDDAMQNLTQPPTPGENEAVPLQYQDGFRLGAAALGLVLLTAAFVFVARK